MQDTVDDRLEQRTPQQLPVKFGTRTPMHDGVTVDVSEKGLFVLTDRPLSPGTAVQLRLAIETCSLPLRGIVAWRRDPQTEDQPGMGVTLLRPPALYTHFVRELNKS